MTEKQSMKDIIDQYSNIAQFSKCLGISRPTMYRYIEWFDREETSKIPDDILKKFNTIKAGSNEFRYRYFTELYGAYLEKQDAFKGETVPKSIADKIDRLELTVDDVDEWIEHTESMIKEFEDRNLTENNYCYNDLVTRLKDLQYTRSLVEARSEERHFINVKEGEMKWIVSTGPAIYNQTIYTEEEVKYKPDLVKGFKVCKAKLNDGYIFYFSGVYESDEIIVNIVAAPLWNEGIKTRIASFSPEPGQRYVKIPKIFDDAHEYAFNYEIERYRDDKLENRIEGMFTIR